MSLGTKIRGVFSESCRKYTAYLEGPYGEVKADTVRQRGRISGT